LVEQLQHITRLTKSPEDIVGAEWTKWSKKVEEYTKLLNKPSTTGLLQVLDVQVAAGNSMECKHN